VQSGNLTGFRIDPDALVAKRFPLATKRRPGMPSTIGA
jgi:hypothetical protein